MKSNIELIENISARCSDQITYYSYNKTLPYSSKYKKGRITSATWINEVCYYFLCKEKNFNKEFLNLLEKKNKELHVLKDGDYKKGLLDEIEDIKKRLNNK